MYYSRKSEVKNAEILTVMIFGRGANFYFHVFHRIYFIWLIYISKLSLGNCTPYVQKTYKNLKTLHGLVYRDI